MTMVTLILAPPNAIPGLAADANSSSGHLCATTLVHRIKMEFQRCREFAPPNDCGPEHGNLFAVYWPRSRASPVAVSFFPSD